MFYLIEKSSVSRPVAGPSRERTELECTTEKTHGRQFTLSHSRHDTRVSKRVKKDTEGQAYTTSPRHDHGVDVVDHGKRVDIVDNRHGRS